MRRILICIIYCYVLFTIANIAYSTPTPVPTPDINKVNVVLTIKLDYDNSLNDSITIQALEALNCHRQQWRSDLGLDLQFSLILDPCVVWRTNDFYDSSKFPVDFFDPSKDDCMFNEIVLGVNQDNWFNMVDEKDPDDNQFMAIFHHGVAMNYELLYLLVNSLSGSFVPIINLGYAIGDDPIPDEYNPSNRSFTAQHYIAASSMYLPGEAEMKFGMLHYCQIMADDTGDKLPIKFFMPFKSCYCEPFNPTYDCVSLCPVQLYQKYIPAHTIYKKDTNYKNGCKYGAGTGELLLLNKKKYDIWNLDGSNQASILDRAIEIENGDVINELWIVFQPVFHLSDFISCFGNNQRHVYWKNLEKLNEFVKYLATKKADCVFTSNNKIYETNAFN